MIELPRRRFLAGLVGLIAAPAVVKAESLMPVKAFDFVPAPYGLSPAQQALPDLLEFQELLWRQSWIDIAHFMIPDPHPTATEIRYRLLELAA